ncbi:MAG: glycosyltransferase WbuB [Marinilabiliales bacterium]|nr:MAG: glycosyltransferase WbuB [Marinilabiliales bacterium]
MKILMVLDHEFPPDVRVENEALALVNAGHEVHLACYTRKDRPQRDNFRGIIIQRIPLSTLLYKASVAALTFPFYFSFWERFLDKIISDNGIEALHIHDLPLAKVGKILKYRYGLKLVVDLHENWPALLKVSAHTRTVAGRLLSPVFLWERYERSILRHADAIIVVVEEARDRLAAEGQDREGIAVVSNTLNRDSFQLPDKGPDPDHYTLYYAGGITYHRGLHTVIEALSLVGDRIPGIRLRIAGSGKYLEPLKDLAGKKNLGTRVEFTGQLTLEEVAGYLAEADAALIPHLKTGHTDSTIPHKLFQYMYANKPVIASDCLPLERIITETQSGIIFRSGSATDLADKLVALYEKRVTVLPARKWVEQKYNWEADAGVLVSLYEK